MRLYVLLLIAVLSVISCKNNDTRLTKETQNQMEKYFSDNKFGSPKTTNDGLMYVINTPGEGAAPLKGDNVTINYKGRLLNGKEFDSTFTPTSGPLTYTVGKTVPGLKETVMIKGFDEAVLLLKQGGSGTFVIPPYLGYASKTVKDSTGNVMIEPNSILVFDIQILEVKKN